MSLTICHAVLQANAGEVRVCLNSAAKVSDCDNVMNDFEKSGVTYKCMAPEDSDSEVVAEIKCLAMIQREEADLTVVGGKLGDG